MSSTLPTVTDQPFLRRRMSSMFRNYHIVSNSGGGDDENGNALESDTFSLMMISKVWSQPWALGMVAFLFQIALGAMIAMDQISLSTDSSLLNVPFKVKPVVRVGQFLTIILCLSTQSDILTSVQSVILLGQDSDWDEVIGERGHRSTSLWIIRILVPNLLKFMQGFLVTGVSFNIIIQSDDIIDLLKDFTALMVLSETDNILFDLASYGYLGKELMDQVGKVSDIKVPEEPTAVTDINPTSLSPSTRRNRKLHSPFCIRYSVILCMFGLMLGGWIGIVVNQMNGKFFRDRYPKCNFTDPVDAFELAKEHFGDGDCYGGPLNSLECAFEGGDCIDFNIAYPLCKGREELIDVQSSVGNGTCEELFMIPECDYDGGDCCHLDIVNSPLHGDNRCHGGIFNTAECGFDKGDCNVFNAAYPQCPLSELGKIKGAEYFVLGDDVCDGIYSSVECGWENGDCDIGQIGQDLEFVKEVHDILFGRSGTMGVLSGGSVSVYRYTEKRWGTLGNLPRRDGERITSFAISMNHAGEDRIALGYDASDDGSTSEQVKVFDYVGSNQTWVQVGQSILEGMITDMTGDGSRLVIWKLFRFGSIKMYELNMAENRWDLVGNAIEGMAFSDIFGVSIAPISSQDGNTVIFSAGIYRHTSLVKIFRYDNILEDWMQLGSDIPSPDTHSSAISSNGMRIAVSSNSSNKAAQGEVRVFDYDEIAKSWVQVGKNIMNALSSDGDGFGHDMAMSGDGNVLAISSVDQKCDTCATGSVQIYLFNSNRNEFFSSKARFSQNGNAIVDRGRDRENTKFGLDISLSGDGSFLSIRGDNFMEYYKFVRVYDLDQLFYIRCLVDNPDLLGDESCYDFYPYNSAECGFDGGDCPLSSVEGYPGCMVSNPAQLWNEYCDVGNLPMYNTSECGYDSGNCLPEPVDGYSGCYLLPQYHHLIGNEECDSWQDPSINTTECDFDGGYCLPKPVDGYPGCYLLPQYHHLIGNEECDLWYDSWSDLPINRTECGFDGGNCLPIPVDGYPGCYLLPEYHPLIGNEQCDSWQDPSLNTTECSFDRGYCLPKPVDGYPGCYLLQEYHGWIGDGYCDSSSDPSFNTIECGYDGGDCLP